VVVGRAGPEIDHWIPSLSLSHSADLPRPKEKSGEAVIDERGSRSRSGSPVKLRAELFGDRMSLRIFSAMLPGVVAPVMFSSVAIRSKYRPLRQQRV
jgi:hypothetical protein